MSILNLTGKQFGKLFVIKYSFTKERVSWWLCKCDCGVIKNIRGTCINTGRTISCGCAIAESNIKGAKHYMCNTHFYTKWAGMKSRILNKNEVGYKNYGGRGIQICKRWYNFLSFKKDMYKSYLIHSKKYGEINTTIERINNNLGYNKKNCKWATRYEQLRNQRSNIYIKFNGKKQIINDWAKEIGLNPVTLWIRLYKNNWSVEKALTTPSRGNWKSKKQV